LLVLKNIKKEYKVADTKFLALKGINLDFRENEFVSILGPSGSGKTTLLNIIGGLDHYSEGQLIINGRETSEFKEKDWNVYRNHRIGFIFQSYNLIPHQSVISNVELALTIAGLSKEERTKKAKEALDKVGLSDQYYKKPNQLSGGQSQRVAIARALVNDPEILLADEPTGALDTKTSVQIMDLIKEVAKDRLVIMVTHNPDLAEKYSTRIINLLDGNVLDDSNPLTNKEKESLYNKKPSNKKEQAKMTWWTTFKLSIQNLLNKRNRSILTSIASSIGIIGISLVLSLSFGVQSFITKTQEDMLSGNPITITKSALDLESMMSGMTIGEKVEVFKEIGYVGVEK
jgi:putative ABC transport system permease protein